MHNTIDDDDDAHINPNQPPTNSIRDIIFSNSPLDQYLQSLNENGEKNDNNYFLEGEVLSFEDFNQDIQEQNQEKEQIENNDNNDNDNNNNEYNENKERTDLKSSSYFNSDLKIFFLSLYQNISSTIIDSDLLHPQESPFIQNPNFSLDFNHDENDEDDNDQLPPIYPLSILNISNNNIINNSFLKNKKIYLYKYLNNVFHKNISSNNKIIISSILIIIPIILYIINPIILIMLSVLLASIIISTIKYINLKIKSINKKTDHISTQIKSLIETSSLHCDNLTKSIQLIREVELISRGYRLSTPLTPIERLEINNPNSNSGANKSEKSFILRAGVSKSLRTSIQLFKQIIDTNFSNKLTNKQKRLYIKSNLSNLYTEPINNNNNNNNNEEEDEELLRMEYDSQLPIITLKMMLHQYQLMISNFFTILIIYSSNIFYNNAKNNQTNININRILKSLDINNNKSDLNILFNLNNILSLLNDLEIVLYNLHSRLSIENNSIKSLISKELWDNKIPKRVLISKPKKTIVESFIYSTNQIAESLNGISPLFTSLHNKIKPFEQQQKEEQDTQDDESISIIDILKLDEVVNDFIKVKSELNHCLKNWESANKSLVKMVRSIPTNNPNLQKEWSEEEASEKLKTLLERLKSHISSHNELIADEDSNVDNSNKFKDYKFPDINSNNNDQWQFYEDIGDLDVYIEKPIPPPPPPLLNDNEEQSTTPSPLTSAPPPPPPPGKGLPRRTKPPKRTVFDPDFDPITQTMKSKSSPSTLSSQKPSSSDPNLGVLIPQKKVITELRSVLDIHISKKNLPI
ncbi:hypothetical protein DICPUDRAFT_87574 [Dictyostelium purpureum]|uniref:Myosin-binding domain-containing protein n=1 Tax=Dictyostelium purpureum TaxID=5786 RepID=F0ZJ01_DICPU|nr:uncharacterized protein DICPUDRAFT_87574 [Dictyostelium purpureum]EGC36071.1 hypothetical protein DICPUDRAFT_87574 [Dictyostelium purpureum]|eukprot:XP_003287389.1 hypothetical protein DICPUDRAFT_87574 [Dictyostelium purpureum]